MDNILYSFIIPHHNCPELLSRMINSIPEREDIEVIVVDDDSDVDKHPIINNRLDVKVIYITKEETKGAGRARNIGMINAKGLWLLFADADDYYNKGFIEELDKFSNENFDVVYFNSSLFDIVEFVEIERSKEWNHQYLRANEDENEMQRVKYFRAPWNKMVRKSFVELYNLHFQECPNGNDAMFSYHVAALSKNIYVCSLPLYCYNINPNGITCKKRTDSQILSNLHNIFKKRYFLSYIDYKYPKPSIVNLLKSKFKQSQYSEIFKILWLFIVNINHIMKNRNEYVECIKEHI